MCETCELSKLNIGILKVNCRNNNNQLKARTRIISNPRFQGSSLVLTLEYINQLEREQLS